MPGDTVEKGTYHGSVATSVQLFDDSGRHFIFDDAGRYENCLWKNDVDEFAELAPVEDTTKSIERSNYFQRIASGRYQEQRKGIQEISIQKQFGWWWSISNGPLNSIERNFSWKLWTWTWVFLKDLKIVASSKSIVLFTIRSGDNCKFCFKTSLLFRSQRTLSCERFAVIEYLRKNLVLTFCA